jgi:hypothetical protein
VFGHISAPTFAALFPVFFMFYYVRTTLISVTDKGLDFYFIESKNNLKYEVYDKISLPYDMITNIKVKKGRFNTGFTFEIAIEDKSYKIKTSVQNKNKKIKEQAENLKQLLETLEKLK